MFTAIHKHYTLDDWKLFAANHPECLQVRLYAGYKWPLLPWKGNHQGSQKDLSWQQIDTQTPRR